MIDDTTEPAIARSPQESSRIGRNLAAMATGQLVTWSMSLLWTLVVPRVLGPSGMGMIVTAWSITGVLGIVLGLGTRNYLVRELVVRGHDGPQLLGTAIFLRLVLTPVFVVAAVIYATVTDMSGDALTVLYLSVAATILIQIAEPMQAAFQALERMQYLAYSDVINKSAQGLAGIAVALAGFGAIGISGVWAFMCGIVVVLNVAWLRGRMQIDLRTNVARLKEMVRASLAYWAFGLFFTVYLWIDALMLSLLTDETTVGWYGVPMKLFQTFMFLPVLISTAWLPKLVRRFEADGLPALQREARRPVELVMVLGLPVSAAIIVAAEPFVDIVYGDAYSGSIPILVVLALCITPMYLNIMLSQVLVAAQRQIAWTWVMGVATVVNPIANLILIPLFERTHGNGGIGAALSLLLTEIAIVSIGFALVGRAVIDRQLVRRTGLTALASGAAWAAGEATAPLGWPVSLVAAGVTLVVLAWSLRLVTREEAAVARRVIARKLPFLRRG
jgi:O-antigen/teichoic acid export membrane protein